MNWDNFFSAFSGASAALIGVTFAFIVSKLLNSISEFDSLYNRCRDLFLEFKEIKLNISNIAYSWHDEMILKYDFQIKKKIKNNVFQGCSNVEIIDYVKKNVPRVYYPEKIISYILDEIKEYNESIQSHRIPINGNVWIQQAEILPTPEIPLNDNLWQEINNEEEKFKKYYQDSCLLIDKFNNSIATINRNINDLSLLKHIIIMFIPIIVITVIYPLHFIPIPENCYPKISFELSNFVANCLSLKGCLLFILFITISGSLLYFSILCFKYIKKHKKLIVEITDNYIDITKYSDLFIKKRI